MTLSGLSRQDVRSTYACSYRLINTDQSRHPNPCGERCVFRWSTISPS